MTFFLLIQTSYLHIKLAYSALQYTHYIFDSFKIKILTQSQKSVCTPTNRFFVWGKGGGGVKEVGEREGSTSYQEVILCMQVNTK